MNSKNDYIREYLGVDKFHAAGYTGKRVHALTGERIEGDNVKEHAKETRLAFLEIAPDAALTYAPFPGASNTAPEFAKLRGDACVMFVSLAVEGSNGAAYADPVIPERMFVCVGAGNYGDNYANGMMAPASVYGVGAVDIVWSATRNGEPVPRCEAAGAERTVHKPQRPRRLRSGNRPVFGWVRRPVPRNILRCSRLPRELSGHLTEGEKYPYAPIP